MLPWARTLYRTRPSKHSIDYGRNRRTPPMSLNPRHSWKPLSFFTLSRLQFFGNNSRSPKTLNPKRTRHHVSPLESKRPSCRDLTAGRPKTRQSKEVYYSVEIIRMNSTGNTNTSTSTILIESIVVYTYIYMHIYESIYICIYIYIYTYRYREWEQKAGSCWCLRAEGLQGQVCRASGQRNFI